MKDDKPEKPDDNLPIKENPNTVNQEAASSLEKTLSEMGVIILNDKDIEKKKPKIGEGTNGKVYGGSFKGEPVAIKKIKLALEESFEDQECLKEILNEIKCAQKVQNQFIPKFYGLWKSKNRYNLVFEFISGKTLKDKYKDLDDKQKLQVLLQLSKILEIIHSEHLIHRDIKPSNIMISDDLNVKLIDFGVSKISQRTETFTGSISGTTRYTAPEYFQIDLTGTQTIHINNKIDIWSTGCLISEIFSGILPWKNKVGNEVHLRRKLMLKTEFWK